MKPRLGSSLKDTQSYFLSTFPSAPPHRVMMPIWADYETLTDSQLITEEQKIPVIHINFGLKIINEA